MASNSSSSSSSSSSVSGSTSRTVIRTDGGTVEVSGAAGVLQVLDRPQDKPFSLSEMDVLGLFAHQAAIALDLLGRARRARAALEGESELAAVSRIAATLDALPPDRREAGLALLAALERVLGP